MAAAGGNRRLPRGLDLLWRVREPQTRGPKPGLSVDQIVATAVEIADAEGVATLSMRRVAEPLGFTTMSLYRYVPGKNELLELMAEAAVDPPSAAAESGASGRVALESWARQLWSAYRRHPWLLNMPVSGPPMGPKGLAWLDSGLAATTRMGLSQGPAIGAVLTLMAYVRGQAQLAISLTTVARNTGIGYEEWGPLYAEVLDRFVTAEEYPTLAAVAASGALTGGMGSTDSPEPGGAGGADGDIDEADRDFEFGMQRVLDGIQAHAESPSGRVSRD